MKSIIAIGSCILAAFAALPQVSAAPTHATVTVQTVAGSYQILLRIGPAEAMSMRPKGGGERMLSGKPATCSMSGDSMGGMSMGSTKCNHHIELHVTDRKTGKVITKARVTIRLLNRRTHAVTNLPVMSMVGARASMSDLHYGNNAALAAGSYTVTVSVNATRASFAVAIK